MIIAARKLNLSHARSRAASLLSPFLVKSALWLLVMGWSGWIAFQWLREALATPARPQTVPSRPAVDLDAAVAIAAATAMFGEPTRIDAAPSAAPPGPAVKLRGVFASGAGPVAAIVEVENEERFVLLDRELAPGLMLRAVHADHIMISRNGAPERIQLEEIRSDAARSKEEHAGATQHSRGHTRRPATPAPEAVVGPGELLPDQTPAPAPPTAPPMQQSRNLPNVQFPDLLARAV